MELRRRSPRFAVTPDTEAYRPSNVAGGFARPFSGPQLWASDVAADEEWVELRWDRARSVGRVELVFNDDVDEDLINLHHHTTPFLVMPELVRDYRLEARIDGAWRVLTEVAGNRRRRRVHDVEAVTTYAVRVVVTATNGDPRVMIAAVRVFES